VVLRVPADARYARVVRVAVSAYAVRLGLAPAAIEDLRLAVDEALILLMGAGGGLVGEEGESTLVVSLDADHDQPPLRVELHLEPTPRPTHPDTAARARFEEIVPVGVTVDGVDQRMGRIALRHPG
jgi:hypothetical protein